MWYYMILKVTFMCSCSHFQLKLYVNANNYMFQGSVLKTLRFMHSYASFYDRFKALEIKRAAS